MGGEGQGGCLRIRLGSRSGLAQRETGSFNPDGSLINAAARLIGSS